MANAGGVRAGAAYVEIFAKDGQFQQSLTRIQNRMKAVGTSMRQIGTQMAIGGAAIGTPMVMALRQFTAFDDAIRMTGAVSQATAPQLAQLTNTARELGATTSFTATQVALLMGELGRAGFSPDQIQDMTGAVLDLSRATGTDATASAGIMAATLRQFGMGATDAARVADVLTAAANKTFNSVEGLGEAMQYAGPVAASMGMDIEQTAAILGTLGNVGIQGSEAGTALRRLLTITGAEAQKLQEIFGVSFLDAAGNVRPLVDTLGEVAAATNGMATGLRTAKFNEAFGLLGITAAGAIGAVAADTRVLEQELRRAGGTANITAKQMDAGLGGSLRILMSAIEGVSLAFGDALAPSLQVVAKGGQLLAEVLRNLLKDFPIIAQVAAGVAGGLFGLGTAAIVGGLAMQVMSRGVGLFAATLRILPALFTPVGAGLAILAGGVTLGVVAARQLSPAFREETDAIMAAIMRLDFATAWQIMNLNFAIALVEMGAAADQTLRQVQGFFEATGAFIGDKLIEGLDRFMGVFGADIITLQSSFEKLGIYFRAAFDWKWAATSMSAALDEAEKREKTARAKAPTADARADARAAKRQESADQRQAEMDQAQAGWEATANELRDDLRRAKETPAEAAPGSPQAGMPPGPPGTPPGGDEAPGATTAASGGGRTVAGFFSSGEGLGIGPELADPAKTTAENTAKIAENTKAALALKGEKLIKDGTLQNTDAQRQAIVGEMERIGAEMSRGVLDLMPRPGEEITTSSVPDQAGNLARMTELQDTLAAFDAFRASQESFIGSPAPVKAPAPQMISEPIRVAAPRVSVLAQQQPQDSFSAVSSSLPVEALQNAVMDGVLAANARSPAASQTTSPISQAGSAVAASTAAAAAPGAAAQAREGLEVVQAIRSMADRLSTGLEAVVAAVNAHAKLTEAGNGLLSKIVDNTGRPGAAFS